MSDHAVSSPERQPPASPPITDYRTAPLGVLPRHLPRWLLLGIAVVMVGIMALPGTIPKPRSAATTLTGAPAAIDANQQRIEEYQRRIDEQTQRLTAEQAALEAVKKDAAELPADGTAVAPHRSSPAPGADRSPSVPRSTTESSAGRGDRSLFVDSVAYTRDARRTASPSPEPQMTAQSAAVTSLPPTNLPSVLQPITAVPAVAPPTSVAAVTAPLASVVATPAPPTTNGTSVSPPPRRYRVPEGSIIETVLTNRLDGTYAGPVNCLVTTAVYAPDHQHLLIPAGARILGDARPVTTFGQVRLAVVFHRVMLPNGSRIDLELFHGLDQIGATGLRDQVDRHYAQIFGASLAVGAIAGLAQTQTSIGLDASALDAYRQGAAANLAQSSARILDRFLNLLPTVTIREGHRIKVYLSNDLELPVYRDEPSSNEHLPHAGERR